MHSMFIIYHLFVSNQCAFTSRHTCYFDFLREMTIRKCTLKKKNQCFGDSHNHRRFCDVTRWSRVTMQRGCCVITRRLSGNHPKHDADFVKNLSFCDFLNVTILQSLCDNFTRNKNFRCCFSRITYVRLILRALNPFFASMLIICEWNISLVHNEWNFFKFDSWTLSTFIK